MLEEKLLQSIPLREKRSTQSELDKVQALPNNIHNVPIIKSVARKFIKDINNLERNLIVSENYLRSINANKDKYFSGNLKDIKDFENEYKIEMERLANLKQD